MEKARWLGGFLAVALLALALSLVAGLGSAGAALDPTPAPAPPPYEIPPPTTSEPVVFNSNSQQDAPAGGNVSPTAPQTAPTSAPKLIKPPVKRVRYLRPFPVVRVAGFSISRGASITLFRVTAPRTATVTVDCRGRGCPLRRLTVAPGRIRTFERFLPVGVTITIRVTRTGYVGKYVRLVIRRRAAPERRDACLLSGHSRPAACTG
jgi:hypothetical protein